MFRYFGFSFISYLHFWFCSLARFLDREHGPVVLGAWVLGRHDIDDGREFGRFAFAFWHSGVGGGAFCRLYSYRPHVASIAAYLAFPVGVAFPEGPELCTIRHALISSIVIISGHLHHNLDRSGAARSCHSSSSSCSPRPYKSEHTPQWVRPVR